jgi:nitrogenase molybdenum-iron protein alpha/beta subunit
MGTTLPSILVKIFMKQWVVLSIKTGKNSSKNIRGMPMVESSKMAGMQKKLHVSEIHRPSAFEGTLWAVLGIKDALTVFHSPSGCYINQHQNALMNDLFEMYTSHLSYADR